MDQRGAVLELALQGLQEAGWDIEFVREFEWDAMSLALSEDRPLIAVLDHPESEDQSLAHAVVICGIADDELVVMDPAIGDYVRLPLRNGRSDITLDFRGGFYVAGVV